MPDLTAFRGKLLSADAARRGSPVHAGAFLRERRVVLDSTLNSNDYRRILVHELFHFAWIRLSNAERASWTALLQMELQRRARGELGWSAEWRKAQIATRKSARFFREYVCESFCDTAAWIHGGDGADHADVTLARRWRVKRRAWFDAAFRDKPVKV